MKRIFWSEVHTITSKPFLDDLCSPAQCECNDAFNGRNRTHFGVIWFFLPTFVFGPLNRFSVELKSRLWPSHTQSQMFLWWSQSITILENDTELRHFEITRQNSFRMWPLQWGRNKKSDLYGLWEEALTVGFWIPTFRDTAAFVERFTMTMTDSSSSTTDSKPIPR